MSKLSVHRGIAVGIEIVSLVCCAAFLTTEGMQTPDVSVSDSLATPRKMAAFTEPSLGSLIETNGCEVFDVSDHHQHGMCGGVHFFRFQYASNSDIKKIVTANDLTMLNFGQVAEQVGGLSIGPDGIASFESLSGMGGFRWRAYAANWHTVPASAVVYYGSTLGPYDCYLFVDTATRTAFLEVPYGMP